MDPLLTLITIGAARRSVKAKSLKRLNSFWDRLLALRNA